MLNPYPAPSYPSRNSTPKKVESLPNTQECNLELEIELNKLEHLILAGCDVPFTNLTAINRDRFLDRLDSIREVLPQALATAVEILRRRQEIIQEAENYSRNLVKSAQEKASQILNESALLHQAELEASTLIYQTQQQCEQLQQQTQTQIEQWRQLAITECQNIQEEADEYADGVLDNIEQQLREMLKIITNGRQKLEENRSQ